MNRSKLMIHRLAILSIALLLAFQQAKAEPLVPPYYAAPIAHSSSTLPEKNISHLRDMLALYQNAATHSWEPIRFHSYLKLNSKGKVIALIRERLTLLGDLAPDNNSDVFDSELDEGVKQFQNRHGLKADGVIGINTMNALNVPPDVRIKQIEINIDRWSTLANKLGSRYIMVNIPEYQLYLIEDDLVVLSMKIIVGKPSRQTPELFSKITRLVFKPYWRVPSKIARKDIMTKAIEDPSYLNEHNIRVFDNEEYSSEIDSQAIDWQTAKENGAQFHFRQDPGENNSLGLVKFEFPNPYDVYLHDTPAKELFSKDTRDFSSGCIRLENPFDLVNYLMKNDPNWDEEKMQTLLSENEPTYVRVKEPLRLVISYITAWVDDNDRLNFREDIYGRDNVENNSEELPQD